MNQNEINTLTPRQALGQVTDEIRDYLRFLSDMGCNGLACSEKSLETIAGWGIVKGRAAALKAGAFRKKAPDMPGAAPAAGSVAPSLRNGGAAPGGATAGTHPAGSGSWKGAADIRKTDSGVSHALPEKRNEVSDSWNRSSHAASAAPDTSDTLERIRADLEHCGRCGNSRSKKNHVFGEGNPRARLMFIGEAPGPEEENLGMPFAGEPGRLLTRMIEAMGLKREDVYLCNLIKCRPSGRNPSPQEISNCRPFIERQIRAVGPEVICTLGAFATMAILGVNEGVAQLRGRFQGYGAIKVMPTFHPVFLLNNPGCKKAAWEDLQKVMAVLGLNRK